MRPLTRNDTASTVNGSETAATNSTPPRGGPIIVLGTVMPTCSQEFAVSSRSRRTTAGRNADAALRFITPNRPTTNAKAASSGSVT